MAALAILLLGRQWPLRHSVITQHPGLQVLDRTAKTLSLLIHHFGHLQDSPATLGLYICKAWWKSLLITTSGKRFVDLGCPLVSFPRVD